MKIINVDNFDRDNYSDELVAENVPERYVDLLVTVLNDKYSGSTSTDYFMAKPDDYKLYIWEP